MKFNLYKDVKKMYQDTYDILIKNEVLNIILLGNLILGNEGIDKRGWRDPVSWFMATITVNDEIKLIGVMTPPFNLTLYEVEQNDLYLSCLIENIISNNIILPGVMCEKKLAERFAKEYTEKMRYDYEIVTNQGIYELTKVNEGINYIGSLRPAREGDYSFIPYWVEDAHSDFRDAPVNKVGSDRSSYRQKELYILEDNGMAVSFAKKSREMKTCCCIGLVYTPPYLRNRGYATSCVAALSQVILERGFSKCALYTDLDYPTSNNIYKKIGYVHMFNSSEIKFIKTVD